MRTPRSSSTGASSRRVSPSRDGGTARGPAARRGRPRGRSVSASTSPSSTAASARRPSSRRSRAGPLRPLPTPVVGPVDRRPARRTGPAAGRVSAQGVGSSMPHRSLTAGPSGPQQDRPSDRSRRASAALAPTAAACDQRPSRSSARSSAVRRTAVRNRSASASCEATAGRAGAARRPSAAAVGVRAQPVGPQVSSDADGARPTCGDRAAPSRPGVGRNGRSLSGRRRRPRPAGSRWPRLLGGRAPRP